MWRSTLFELECPFTWDETEVLSEEERRQLLDRLIVFPKNWKRVVAKLQIAYSEYLDGDSSKAKTSLIEAFSGIVETFGEIHGCGATTLFREALRHVLDATWAHIEVDELDWEGSSDEDDEDDDDNDDNDDDDFVAGEDADADDDEDNSPRYKNIRAFVERITPVRKMNHQQKAALLAIRAAVADSDVEGIALIQKAIHLCPTEAQWRIDLALRLRGEDPEIPMPRNMNLTMPELNLVLLAMNLIDSKSSPSHCSKNAAAQRVQKMMDRHSGRSGRLWPADLEMMLLAGGDLLAVVDPPKHTCDKKACRGKKKCACLIPGWLCNVMHCAVTTNCVSFKGSLAVLFYLALTVLAAGFPNEAIVGLNAVSSMAPSCQYVHHRIALVHALDAKDKKKAALAMDHAKRCELLYPMTKDLVKKAIERAAISGPPKPVPVTLTAGSRRKR